MFSIVRLSRSCRRCWDLTQSVGGAAAGCIHIRAALSELPILSLLLSSPLCCCQYDLLPVGSSLMISPTLVTRALFSDSKQYVIQSTRLHNQSIHNPTSCLLINLDHYAFNAKLSQFCYEDVTPTAKWTRRAVSIRARHKDTVSIAVVLIMGRAVCGGYSALCRLALSSRRTAHRHSVSSGAGACQNHVQPSRVSSNAVDS